MIICVFSISHTNFSCRICIKGSSLSWYFGSWMHKTLVGMTTIRGFTFIVVVVVIGYWVGKFFLLNKKRLGVVPNSYFFSGWSLLPQLFKILIGFSLACHLGIWSHLSYVIKSIVPNALIVFFGVFNSNIFNFSVGSWYTWSTFGELICVDYWVPSFVDLFISSTSIWTTIITTSFSIGWSI